MKTTLLILLAIASSALRLIGSGLCSPSIGFSNQSGSPATVKLVGPTRRLVEVTNGGSKSVSVEGGEYYILTRYGTPGHYRFTRGDAFHVVHQGNSAGERCSAITITLHKVVNGNYGSRDSSPDEFNGR
jgi:hypothetical protein